MFFLRILLFFALVAPASGSESNRTDSALKVTKKGRPLSRLACRSFLSPAPLSYHIDGLEIPDSILKRIRRVPSPKDIHRDLSEYRISKDPVLRRKIADQSLSLAAKIAAIGAQLYELRSDFNELFQSANLGLLRAIERFNPKEEASFVTYATYWISSYVQREAEFLRGRGVLSHGRIDRMGFEKFLTYQPIDERVDPSMLSDARTPAPDDPAMQRSKSWHIKRIIGLALFEKISTRPDRIDLVRKRWFSAPPVPLREIAKERGVTLQAIDQEMAKLFFEVIDYLEKRPLLRRQLLDYR